MHFFYRSILTLTSFSLLSLTLPALHGLPSEPQIAGSPAAPFAPVTPSSVPLVEPSQLYSDYSPHKINILKATVDYIESLFLTNYGPIRWKQQQWGWNPQKQAALAKEQLDCLSDSSIESIKPIFLRLFDSTKDAHVGVRFAQKGAYTMPLEVQLIDGKLIVVYSGLCDICVGDELLTVNNMSPFDYASQVRYGVKWDEAPIDRPILRMRNLFSRDGCRSPLPDPSELPLLCVDRGPFRIHTTGSWKYLAEPDWVIDSNDKEDITPDESNPPKFFHELSKQTFAKPLDEQHFERLVASTRPPVENLVAPHTRYDKAHWLIKPYNNKRIGYFRLPDFYDDRHLETFDEALPELNEQTDALLIDLRDNPGGADYLCFAFLSRLTDQPLLNLLESRILCEKEVHEAKKNYENIKSILDKTNDEKLIHSMVGEEIRGYWITPQLLQDMMLESKSRIEEWASGSTCTRFSPHNGLRYIEPHPKLRYTKPLYILINERDGSCADYFPAVLKDNARATLMGRTTTGAGGVVRGYEIPNIAGIESFSLTCSLLLRNNQRIIEDLGVEPHYEFPLTLENVSSIRTDAFQAFEIIWQQLSGREGQNEEEAAELDEAITQDDVIAQATLVDAGIED